MTAITAMQYNLLSTSRRFSDYETVGGLFKDATRSSVELTLVERIWDMILEIVCEIDLKTANSYDSSVEIDVNEEQD
ncbi:MAG: hypothetical protein IJL54_02135 [Prevotella sp.]|nr:hypothetical protein [Prevotella sp.]